MMGMESAGKTDERKAYCINTDSFTAALAELIRVYQSETPGMEYRCKCHDGTIVTIRSGKPPKAKRASKNMALPTETT